MKISINKETYYNNPCPKITKGMWDWFYSTLWCSFRDRNHTGVKKIHTMDIRINQAYKGCATIHFYITINKGLKDSFEFHKECFGTPEKELRPYLESAHSRILDHGGSDEPVISFIDAFNAPIILSIVSILQNKRFL